MSLNEGHPHRFSFCYRQRLMPPTRRYEIPDELAEKLEKMATGQGKTAEMLLMEIVTEYIEMTEAILRNAEQRSRKRKR